MLRFREAHRAGPAAAVTERVLLNAHDGSSAFQLDPGRFRLVCSNGMLTSIGMAGKLSRGGI